MSINITHKNTETHINIGKYNLNFKKYLNPLKFKEELATKFITSFIYSNYHLNFKSLISLDFRSTLEERQYKLFTDSKIRQLKKPEKDILIGYYNIISSVYILNIVVNDLNSYINKNKLILSSNLVFELIELIKFLKEALLLRIKAISTIGYGFNKKNNLDDLNIFKVQKDLKLKLKYLNIVVDSEDILKRKLNYMTKTLLFGEGVNGKSK